MLAGQVVDALTTPLVGVLSDHVKVRRKEEEGGGRGRKEGGAGGLVGVPFPHSQSLPMIHASQQ